MDEVPLLVVMATLGNTSMRQCLFLACDSYLECGAGMFKAEFAKSKKGHGML